MSASTQNLSPEITDWLFDSRSEGITSSNGSFISGVKETVASQKAKMSSSPSPLMSHGPRIPAHSHKTVSWKDRGIATAASVVPKSWKKKTFRQKGNKILHTSPSVAAKKQKNNRKKRSQKHHKQRVRSMVSQKHGPLFVNTTTSDALVKSPLLPKDVIMRTPKKKKFVTNLLDARGMWVVDQVRGMSITQLHRIAEKN